MKIVVCKLFDNDNPPCQWEWRIVINSGKEIAYGHALYSRKSDAKRGAARFEQKLWRAYQDLNIDQDGLDIEVIE